MRKILVTGSKGFIGRNLIARLRERDDIEIFTFDTDNSLNELETYIEKADFIIHLAGVNRPKNEAEFKTGNVELTQNIINILEKQNKRTPILITSSIQAELDNAYGRSKKEAEESLIQFNEKYSSPIYIFRLPNVFGKWCRPNYNSVVATFCYNISHELDIIISDENKELSLVYIDDVVESLISCINQVEYTSDIYYYVSKSYQVTLGEIASKLKQFRRIKETSIIPDLSDDFTKCLYSTYLSYLDEDDFSYDLVKKQDNRGWLAELVKSSQFGQMFVSKTHKGITRGNHYHHTKVEKFIVIQGKAIIRFRNICDETVTEYRVEGETPKVVDIPPGFTHSIENIGEEELITLFWSNEIFNQEKPDTFYNEVIR